MAGTFSDWIQERIKKGYEPIFTVNRPRDFNRLQNSWLPTFEYRSFDPKDIPGMKAFQEKYGLIVSILYPKKKSDGQPYEQPDSFDKLMKFLKENEPLSRFDLFLGESKKSEMGGTIISDGIEVRCEIGEGRQDNLAHGNFSKDEIFRGESKFEMPVKYSSNCTIKMRELIWKALKYIKSGRIFEKGYFEFFVCQGDIYFIDYKTDPKFYKLSWCPPDDTVIA